MCNRCMQIMPLKRHISKSSKREIYIDLVTIITTIITWKRRRKFRKRNETGFSLFHPFLELTLIRAMWYFFPPFHRGSSVSILWIPRLSSVRLCFDVSSDDTKREIWWRRQEGIITGTRPLAVDRDEESEASICLPRGVSIRLLDSWTLPRGM